MASILCVLGKVQMAWFYFTLHYASLTEGGSENHCCMVVLWADRYSEMARLQTARRRNLRASMSTKAPCFPANAHPHPFMCPFKTKIRPGFGSGVVFWINLYYGLFKTAPFGLINTKLRISDVFVSLIGSLGPRQIFDEVSQSRSGKASCS